MPAWLDEMMRSGLDSIMSLYLIVSGGLAMLESPVLGLVIVTVLLSGILRGFVGFGSSLTIVMVLSVQIGPPAAVAIAGLSGLAPVLQLLPTAIRHAERSFVLPFCLLMFIAAPVGTWLLVTIDKALMKVMISLFILAMVWMLYREWRPKSVDRPGFLMLTGAASGLLQGCAGVGGPPAVAIALSRKGTAQVQRANVIGATGALALSGLPPLWYYGVITVQVIAISLAAMPFYALGTWLGSRWFSRHGQQYFRNAALLALAVVGAVTLGLALSDYFGWSCAGLSFGSLEIARWVCR